MRLSYDLQLRYFFFAHLDSFFRAIASSFFKVYLRLFKHSINFFHRIRSNRVFFVLRMFNQMLTQPFLVAGCKGCIKILE